MSTKSWIESLKDETLIPMKLKKCLNVKRLKHLDDVSELKEKYMIQLTMLQYGFKNNYSELRFWEEFKSRGHTNLESMRCECCVGKSG
jgi:hypothetical protein